ncbi:MAG: alanine racemase [Acidobacteria bacterium]|nr:alanine racemase [Acidobacteriota bacterium]
MNLSDAETFISPNVRPTVAIIDLDKLASNFRAIKALCEPDTKILAVVKANAYGHGAVECSKTLAAAGADQFGVAIVEEGIELRDAGISQPILCIGGIWPGDEERVIRHNITPVILTTEMAERLNRAAAERQTTVDVHLKLDTGMGRVGVVLDELPSFIDTLLNLKNIRVTGVMTHFAAANDPNETEFTERQIADFYRGVELLRSRGIQPEILDMANSPAAVLYKSSHGNMIRPGGLLYGFGDILPSGSRVEGIEPVMSLRTKVAMVKDVPAGASIGYARSFVTQRASRIATLPIGYNDGYTRSLSNKGEVLICGKAAPVIGRISMDWTTVDITGIPEVSAGSDVILIGSDGSESITADDVAAQCGTISYEITCGITSRIPRIYIK